MPTLEYTPTVLVVPGSPAVVQELAPGDSAGAKIRRVVKSLVSGAPLHVVGSSDPRWRTTHAGSFRAWGAPVSVGGGRDLSELVARYLVGDVAEFRPSIQPVDPAAQTVVVLDGPAGLTARAPLSLLPHARRVHEQLQGLLRGEQVGLNEDELRAAGVIEPKLWLELARLRPTSAQLLLADDTHGVGRYVAAWKV